MAQTVKIISDSTCDLSKDLLEKYDITILPLHILLGETEYRDGIDITPEEIFRWSDENKTTPKTSAPSMTEAMEVMKPFLDEGREIICFSISDSMSTSGNVMRLAAEDLEASDRVTVINSHKPVYRYRTAGNTGCHFIRRRENQSPDHCCHRRDPPQSPRQLRRRYPDLSLSRWQMQCRSCSSRRYVKASPQDRSRRRCHGCLQKIPW